MNIVIESKQSKGIESFMIPSSQQEMLKIVAETGKIEAKITAYSKTRFGFSLQAGEHQIGFNTLPKGETPQSYKYKMHLETKTNWFSGDRVTVAYFVKSKKQMLDQMKDHMLAIFNDYVKPNLPETMPEVKIELIETNAYYTLQG